MANTHNDEIDLKEVFSIISKYKISIMFITLIFLVISSVFAYYKPNIYSASTSLEILKQDQGIGNSAFTQIALGGDKTNLENNIAVIQSRFVVQKALENLDLGVRYYSQNKFLKSTELYKQAPVRVILLSLSDAMYGKKFELVPLNSTSFRLVIKGVSTYSIKNILAQLKLKPLKENDKISYNKIHKYGEEITTPLFTFIVKKTKPLDNLTYSFSFIKSKQLYDNYIANLSVSSVSEFSSVLKLSYQDNVSLRAKEILNAISGSYISKGIEQKTKASGLTLGFIDKQLNVIKVNLTNSEKNLENYKVNNSVINFTGKVALETQKVADYEAEQLELQTEINILNHVKKYIYENKDLSGLSIGTVKFTDNRLSLLLVSLQALTEAKEKLTSEYTELHPDVVKLSNSIRIAKKSIKQAVQNSLNQLNQRSLDLGNMISKFNESLKSLPTEEKKLAQLLRPLKVNQKIYEYLLQKKAETAILKSSTIADARILDIARENTTPIKPKRKLIVLVGMILGLIVGVALSFLREFLKNTVHNTDEIEKATSLPIYGIIPFNKNESSENIYKEAFRNLRTNLQFLPGSEQNKVISITSSISGEGKTTISSMLGEILAKGNKKVILLDLDLRKSSLHKGFDVTNTVGISNYLIAQNTLDEVIKATDIDGLDMITTGPLPPNPSELILSPTFKELLRVLRDKYDYILIDTPPAGLVTDAVIIMNYSDLSLAVIRANYTRKEFIKNIDKLASEHEGNRVGLILNGVKIGSEYGYGYGYGYSSKYGNSEYYK